MTPQQTPHSLYNVSDLGALLHPSPSSSTPDVSADLTQLSVERGVFSSEAAFAQWRAELKAAIDRALAEKSIIPPADAMSLIALSEDTETEPVVRKCDVTTLIENSFLSYSPDAAATIIRLLGRAGWRSCATKSPTSDENAEITLSERIEDLLHSYFSNTTYRGSVHDTIKIMHAARVAKFQIAGGLRYLSNVKEGGCPIDIRSILSAVSEAALGKEFSDSSLRFVSSCGSTLSAAIPTLPGDDACRLFRSLAVLHTVHHSLTPPLQRRIRECLPELEAEDLGRLCQGIGELGFVDGALIDPLLERITELSHATSLPSRRITTIVWSMSIVCSAESFERIWDLVRQPRFRVRDPESARLLKQAAIVRNCTFPAELAEQVEFLFSRVEDRNNEHKAPTNGFEGAVGRRLRSLGYKVQYGKHVSGVDVDIVTTIPRIGPTAIFCDGVRYHRINQDPSGLLCGPDKLANKLVTLAGYRPVRITDVDFKAHRHDPSWLRKKIIHPEMP